MFLDNFNFEKLIAPIGKQVFYDQYFGRKQLLIKRQDADFYQRLLTPAMLDDLLFQWPNLATVVKSDKFDGRRQDMHGNVVQSNTATVLNELDQGSTLILDKLDNRLPTLTEMHALLEKETHYQFQSNIYITPPSQQGFRAHFDDHHVFILQTQGSKQWRVNHHPESLNTPGEEATKQQINEAAHEAFLLEVGDLLYIPPYTVHEAAGQGEYSIHITLSPYPPTYRSLLNHCLKDLSAEHPINKPLPMGYFDVNDADLMAHTITAVQEVLLSLEKHNLNTFKNDSFEALRGLYNGALRERIQSTSPHEGSVYQTNQRLIMQIETQEDTIAIKLPKKVATFPALFESSLLFCLNSDSFTLADIPEVDLDEAKILVGRLLAEGLILLKSPEA